MKNKIGRPKKLKAEKVCFVGVSIPPELNAKLKDVMRLTGKRKGQVIADMIGAYNV